MADEAAQCIFCRIIAGEMESRKVYEDERAFACLDIRPGVKGHTLLMPKEHYPILPTLPQKEFEHLFGLLPTLLSALGGALGKTGANVFIANGAAAGQQSPHFLMHLLLREPMDSLNLYALRGEGALREHDELLPVLRQKLGKPGASGAARPPHLSNVDGDTLFSEGGVVCVSPARPLVPGHLVLYPAEHAAFASLPKESSSNLFRAGTTLASLIFQLCSAQGTNLILKTGNADDNPGGFTALHVIPRTADDGLRLQWEPREMDLTPIAQQVSAMMPVREEKKVLKTITFREPMRIGGAPAPVTAREEIAAAIRNVQSVY